MSLNHPSSRYFRQLQILVCCCGLAISVGQTEAAETISGRDPIVGDGVPDAWSAITVLTTPMNVPSGDVSTGTVTRFRYWAVPTRAQGGNLVQPLLLERVNGVYTVIGVGERQIPTSGGSKDVTFSLQTGTATMDLTRVGVTYHPGVLQYSGRRDDSNGGLVPFEDNGGEGVFLDNIPIPNTSYAPPIGLTVQREANFPAGGRNYSFHFEADFEVTPTPPTDLELEGLGIFTGMPGGAKIASMTATDESVDETFVYSLVSNPGGTFTIEGSELKVASGAVINQSSYTMTLRVVDSTFLSFEKEFTINVSSPSPPSGLLLSASAVSAGLPIGDVVGFLSTTDSDVNDAHTYALISGPGDDNNSLCSIIGNELTLSAALPSTEDPLRIRVQTTDLAGLSLTETFALTTLEARLRITEFLSSNDSGLQDEDGDFSDWIELFNETETPISLGGYYLTNDQENPTKWVFPDLELGPRAYLIVYASSKDRRNAGSELHTNFGLSSNGGYLALVEQNGFTVVDQYAPDEQLVDLSFGRGAGEGAPGFLTPTPGSANGPSFEAGQSEVIFSQERGFYSSPFQLNLSGSLSGSQIYYTLDGSVPADGMGTLYAGPIVISPLGSGTQQGSRVVRAIAVNASGATQPVATHTYLFVSGLTQQSNFERSITDNPTYGALLDDALLAHPAVSIVGGFPGSTEGERSIEFFTPDGSEPGFQINCGVKMVGGGSLASPKNNFRLYFRSDYGAPKLRYPLFENHPYSTDGAVDTFDRLNLRGGAHDTFYWLANPSTPGNSGGVQKGDAQYIRNRWMSDMQFRMGQLSLHGRWVQVYVNGAYHGQYQLHEWPNNDYLGSYLPGSEDDYEYTNSANLSKNGSDNWPAVWASIEAAAATSYAEAARWIDMENFADYMILSFYGGNPWDWMPNQNWMAGGSGVPDSPKGKWKFFAWDTDIVLQDPLANVLDAGVPDGLFDTMMNHEEFRILLRDRIYHHCFHDGVLTPSQVGIAHSLRADEVRTSIVAETARWQQNGALEAVNPPWDRDDEWQSELDRTAAFFEIRTEILMDQFRAESNFYPLEAPEFIQRGGIVDVGHTPVLTADEGAIYFTTDGSDPRLPGGGIAPGAMPLGGNPVQSFISEGAIWKYLDDGSDQGTGWQSVSFDDSAWASGAAELGYGENDLATEVGFIDTSPAAGIQRNITTYYRHAFDLADASRVVRLTGLLKRDDGAVVYLNGEEIFRDNIASGAVDYQTPASPAGADDGNTFIPFEVGLGNYSLNDGINVIAVEIHQSSSGSSDTTFDFALSAEIATSTSGLTVSDNTIIRARAYNGTTWSAINQANFTVTGTLAASFENLLLTEINYNPQLADDWEFLEFQNTATVSVDLSGVSISGGITFTFPAGTVLQPGEYLVVVEDEVAFADRYGSPTSSWYLADLKVAGEWSGGLSNGGEVIQLNAADGSPLYTVEYSDGGSWPGRGDGKGSSIELENPAGVPATQPELNDYLSSGNRWRSSSEYHGSPGRPGAGSDNRVVFNEVLANTNEPALDTFELFSRSSENLDLGGWVLSDDSDFYQKFAIPAGTTLNAGGYLFFDEDDFNNTNLSPFSLSGSKGDDLYLMEVNAAGDLLRFVDRVEFGASATGEAFGRWPNGEGNLYPMLATTFGMSNEAGGNGVRVGALVISEIHYNPDGVDDGFEFIRISNAGVNDQSMDQWKLRGEVDFDFPADLTLVQGESLILVGFDPLNAALKDAFTAEFSPDPATPLFGPWNDGGVVPTKLSDGGGSLRLLRPDDLFTPPDGAAAFFPGLIEDSVRYQDEPPWPLGADGSGASLLRISSSIYGDNPFNWRALNSPLGDAPASVYDTWAESAFPNGTSEGDRLPGADFDGDGVSNFLEYAFLLNPLATESTRPIEVSRSADGSELLISYRKRSPANSLQYSLRISPDLSGWETELNDLPVVSEVAIPGSEGVVMTVRYTIPAVDGSKQFFRVQVLE